MTQEQAGRVPVEGSDPSPVVNTGSPIDPRGTCVACDGPLGEDNIDRVCGPCVAEIVEPEPEPCGTFRSIGVGRLGDAERALFCACGWEFADHAVWCDYCETGNHQTAACPFPDHDAYDAAHGVAHCCAAYSRTDGPFGSIVETHTRGCDAI